MKGRNQGIASKNVAHPAYRTGGANRKAHPRGVAQMGSAISNHTMREGNIGYRGGTVFGHGPAIPSKLGNEVSATTVCGPGGSRQIHRSGSQGGLVTRANAPRGRAID